MTDPPSSFDQALACVLAAEGGFSTDPADPGNWTGGAVGAGACLGTNWGISASAFPTTNIAGLTRTQAGAIYHAQYWAPVAADHLPPPLALLVFDAAVNNGVDRAARFLQQALGVTEDGDIGPQTLAAVAAAPDPLALAAEYQARRTDYMARLPNWTTFGLGWARRLCVLPFRAVAMR